MQRPQFPPPPHAVLSAQSLLPQQPATNQRTVASHPQPTSHRLPSEAKPELPPLPTAAHTPAWHANSLALRQNLQQAGCTAFLSEDAVATYPPSCLKAGHPGWRISAGCMLDHLRPRPCGTASLAGSLLPRGPEALLGAGMWGGGLLAREGVSPQPGCSPLAAVCMQGVKSTLTQREEQAEASEEQGGLREPGFRAHFEGLLCMERTWCWCGFWWWWFAFFERPGYLQVTYNIRAALFPQPNMAGWSSAGSKKSVNAMVGGFQQGKWEGRKIFP